MRPTPIKDEEVPEGALRRIMAAPNGDLMDDDIRPAEALITNHRLGAHAYTVRLELEGDDLQRLQDGEPIWLTMLGGLAPFYAFVSDKP